MVTHDDSMNSLMHLVEKMSPIGHLLHAETFVNGKLLWSIDTARDAGRTLRMGMKASVRLGIHRFAGFHMARGKKIISPLKDFCVSASHLVASWTDVSLPRVQICWHMAD